MSIRNHTAFNLVGALLPMAFSIFTIPLYLELIGESRYGVMAITWLLVGYFGLFDLGLGRATAQRIANLKDSSPLSLSRVFWTALVLNSGMGVVGGLIIWPIANYVFENVVKLDAGLRPEMLAAIPWLILAVPLATISGVLTGALQGRKRFFELNAISIVSSLLIQIIPLLVAWFYGPDLGLLIPVVVLVRLSTLMTLFARCRVHILSDLKARFSKSLSVELLHFGGWVTITAIVGPMMVIFDRFLIGAILGAKAVTHYTIPFQLAERTGILSGALASAMFPHFASVTEKERQLIANKAIRSLVAIISPAFFLGIYFAGPLLNLWLGLDLAESVKTTAQILLLGFWINSIAKVPSALLQASGRPRAVAYAHLIEVIPYLIFLWVGVQFWGILGAAIAFGLRTATDTVILSWLSGILRTNVLAMCVPAVILFGALLLSPSIVVETSIWSISVFVGLLSVVSIWSWNIAPRELRNFVKRAHN